MAYPAQLALRSAVADDHIEAQWSSIKFGVALQQSSRGTQDARAFASIDARRGTSPLTPMPMAHFNDEYNARV